jgi:hypothetical protein
VAQLTSTPLRCTQSPVSLVLTAGRWLLRSLLLRLEQQDLLLLQRRLLLLQRRLLLCGSCSPQLQLYSSNLVLGELDLQLQRALLLGKESSRRQRQASRVLRLLDLSIDLVDCLLVLAETLYHPRREFSFDGNFLFRFEKARRYASRDDVNDFWCVLSVRDAY